MKKFNVLIYNFNEKEVEPYDVIKSLVNDAKTRKSKIKSLLEARAYVFNYAKYIWSRRCEYELVIDSFPPSKERKIDIYDQIIMNIEVISEIFFNEMNHPHKTKNKM